MSGDAADTDKANSNEARKAKTDFMAREPAKRKAPILEYATDYEKYFIRIF
jgi:hypothetical protein